MYESTTRVWRPVGSIGCPFLIESLPSGFPAKEEKKEGEEKPATPVVLGPKDPYEIMFARAEGLHAHGHNREACILGAKLAEELLENPPNLMLELPPVVTKGKRKKVPIHMEEVEVE